MEERRSRERLERRIEQLEVDLEIHRNDAYAHGRLIGRIMQESLTLREKFENRLAATERRIGALEGFKGQVTLLGGIGFLLLGVTLAGLVQRILGWHF